VTPWIAVGAAGAMLAQDILGTLLVQAQARNRAAMAGVLDAVGWCAQMTTTAIGVTAILTGTWPVRIAVFSAITAANFFGSYGGVKIGQRLIKER
jgi:hypothetical protein